jgi:hypothetical protein
MHLHLHRVLPVAAFPSIMEDLVISDVRLIHDLFLPHFLISTKQP